MPTSQSGAQPAPIDGRDVQEKKKKKKRSIRDVKKVLWGDKKTKKKLMDEIDNY